MIQRLMEKAWMALTIAREISGGDERELYERGSRV